jgi:hypothetical protein
MSPVVSVGKKDHWRMVVAGIRISYCIVDLGFDKLTA